jgi:hypothetical protein
LGGFSIATFDYQRVHSLNHGIWIMGSQRLYSTLGDRKLLSYTVTCWIWGCTTWWFPTICCFFNYPCLSFPISFESFAVLWAFICVDIHG